MRTYCALCPHPARGQSLGCAAAAAAAAGTAVHRRKRHDELAGIYGISGLVRGAVHAASATGACAGLPAVPFAARGDPLPDASTAARISTCRGTTAASTALSAALPPGLSQTCSALQPGSVLRLLPTLRPSSRNSYMYQPPLSAALTLLLARLSARRSG